MKKKNIIVIITVLAIVAGTTWFFFGRTTLHNVTYQTTTVARGNISNSVTATGTLEPVTVVDVGTQVSGIVSSIYVDFNSEVHKGQIIAELDKTNLLNQLESQQSTLANAKTQYDYQLLNYTRLNTLHEKGLVSDTDYETAWYSYETAKNSYNVSRTNLATAETNLGYATIYSPIDGVVLSRDVEEGQTVASSFSTPTLFTIARDLTDMRVIADVDEADIGQVEVGLRSTFTVDAFPNDTFEGMVTQVRQQATTTNNVVTYEVVVSAPNPDLKLKPGLTANIAIYTQVRDTVLAVPAKALRFTPVKELIGADDEVIDAPEAKHKLWTRENKTFTAHEVETGVSNGVLTEIISGIPEGTVVITDAVIGQLPGSETAESQQGQSEQSPFMPGRPGGR